VPSPHSHAGDVQFWFVGVNLLLAMRVPTVPASLAQRYTTRGLTPGALKGL